MKTLLYIILACLFSFSAIAQEKTKKQETPPNQPPRSLNAQSSQYFSGRETATMGQRLSLNNKQLAAVAELNNRYYQSVAILMQDKQEPASRKSKIDQLRLERNANLQKILSAE